MQMIEKFCGLSTSQQNVGMQTVQVAGTQACPQGRGLPSCRTANDNSCHLLIARQTQHCPVPTAPKPRVQLQSMMRAESIMKLENLKSLPHPQLTTSISPLQNRYDTCLHDGLLGEPQYSGSKLRLLSQKICETQLKL